jgi:elongation factor G
VRYLPSPLDTPPVQRHDPVTGKPAYRKSDPDEDLCTLAFKVVVQEDRKLVYIRIYSGSLKVGKDVYNVNLQKKEKISKVYKIHASHKDRVEQARTGEIVGIVGLKETSTGHTLTRISRFSWSRSNSTSPSSRWP